MLPEPIYNIGLVWLVSPPDAAVVKKMKPFRKRPLLAGVALGMIYLQHVSPAATTPPVTKTFTDALRLKIRAAKTFDPIPDDSFLERMSVCVCAEDDDNDNDALIASNWDSETGRGLDR